MKELYLIGTGGGAKEIVQLIEQINSFKEQFVIKGFIEMTTKKASIDILTNQYPLIQEEAFISSKMTGGLVITSGFPETRSKIYATFQEYTFPNIIHPSVDIHPTVSIGFANIIKTGTIITTDIQIGNNNYLNRGAQIGHDNKIGNHNVINPGAILSGNINLGDRNLIGTQSAILQNLNIGNDNQVGAGAIVTKNIRNSKTVKGIPAKSV